MVLDDLATLLATACSLTVGTTLFKGAMPATPDACLALIEYPGIGPDFVFGQAAIAQESPRLQVLCRGGRDDYETPRDVAETAYRALAAAQPQTIASTRYQRFLPLQAPFRLGAQDENGRYVIAFNVQVDKELSA